MFKIDNSRKIVLENGLIEVVRFPRNWKMGANQLWDLGQENAAKLVRVMIPNFKDARVYMSKRVEEPGPGVVELPRYYAIGINKNGDWYTEESMLAFSALPRHIVERAEQVLTINPFVAALRKNWFTVLATSLLLSTIAGMLTGELLLPNAGTWTILTAMAMAWVKIGFAYCGLIFSFNTVDNYLKYHRLEKALDELEAVSEPRSQPLPSSELV